MHHLRMVATALCRRTAVARLSLAVGLTLLAVSGVEPAGDVFPAGKWAHYRRPEDGGWASSGLAEAKKLSASTVMTSWVLVQGGMIVDEWGQVAQPVLIHSMRKSIISALYGIYASRGVVRLSATLAELGIDDLPPSLSKREKTAQVVDLLKARSGVYHDAACETPGMKEKRPARGSHPPGTFWYYNNWDFNALGSILAQQTGKSVFDAFDQEIARKVGMENFVVSRDTKNMLEKESKHACYAMWLSSHDMARFGLLYLNEGRWNQQQLVPRSWVEESTTSYSEASPDVGYGYLWWLGVEGHPFLGHRFSGKVYSAEGSYGQYVVVAPSYDLVFACNVAGKEALSNKDFHKILSTIMKSRRAPGATQPVS